MKYSYTKSRISGLYYHRWNRKIHDILCFTNCSSRASILSLPQACRYATFLTARKFQKVYTISRCDKILLQSIQRLVSSAAQFNRVNDYKLYILVEIMHAKFAQNEKKSFVHSRGKKKTRAQNCRILISRIFTSVLFVSLYTQQH